jgi:hypothetical protein
MRVEYVLTGADDTFNSAVDPVPIGYKYVARIVKGGK